jgi:hypothetical protein
MRRNIVTQRGEDNLAKSDVRSTQRRVQIANGGVHRGDKLQVTWRDSNEVLVSFFAWAHRPCHSVDLFLTAALSPLLLFLWSTASLMPRREGRVKGAAACGLCVRVGAGVKDGRKVWRVVVLLGVETSK